MRRTILVTLLMSITVSACSSKDLSKSSAADIIKRINEYPKQITGNVRTGHDFMVGGLYRDYEKHIIPQLNEFGLAEASYKSGPPFGRATVILSKSSSQYIISRGQEINSNFLGVPDIYTDVTVLTHTCNLGEVTGIAYLNENKTAAKVEYTQVCEPTPFGKMKRYSMESVTKRSVTLMLYDDGWRKMESPF